MPSATACKTRRGDWGAQYYYYYYHSHAGHINNESLTRVVVGETSSIMTLVQQG